VSTNNQKNTKQPHFIVLAAGKGVRMRSAKPKVLHQVCGVTLLERVLYACAGLAPKEISVVTGNKRELVEAELETIQKREYFSKIKISSVFQKEQKGTGDAVISALEQIKGNPELFFILPADIPLLSKETLEVALNSWKENKCPEIFLLTTYLDDPTGYGRIVRDNDGSVQAIVEEKDCNAEQRAIREVNTSIYIVKPEFLRSAVKTLNSNNSQGEFYLTDIVSVAYQNKQSVCAEAALNGIEVAGANSRFELAELDRLRRLQINIHWCDLGVSFEDIEQAYVDERVELGEDCFVGANTRIQGDTKIANNVVIEGDSLITESTIDSGTRIKLGCYIEESSIGKDCTLGPFCHIRPGTILDEQVKIGNFVEIKKSHLQARAKAPHLTYLGDSTVGENANVGAGTITCNYDGKNKFKTVIKNGAFIGSNSSLVAPVVIGEGATVGAGSVITKDVPDSALAVERSEQRMVNNWKSKKSKK
jgi:bifunctional UDP-N-acetylglucosamine pyrophosphorylase / glucosamine-1-phosphate N-acetyltransferase